MNLFLDFDGTIIDPRKRYYRAHIDALTSEPVLQEDAYWSLKRQKIIEQKIIADHYPHEPFEAYEKKRVASLEDPSCLALDMLIDGMIETLNALRASHAPILVTLRHKKEHLFDELASLGIEQLFTHILTSPPGTNPAMTKRDMIAVHAQPGDWIIGDTEADIQAGQQLKITTCGVLSGIRDEAFLKALQPDHIIATIRELQTLLR